MPPKYVYLSNNKKFFVGIPARNLTQDDIRKFNIDEKFLKETGVYVPFEEPVKDFEPEPEEVEEEEFVEKSKSKKKE